MFCFYNTVLKSSLPLLLHSLNALWVAGTLVSEPYSEINTAFVRPQFESEHSISGEDKAENFSGVWFVGLLPLSVAAQLRTVKS